jgi:hypothetical protein
VGDEVWVGEGVGTSEGRRETNSEGITLGLRVKFNSLSDRRGGKRFSSRKSTLLGSQTTLSMWSKIASSQVSAQSSNLGGIVERLKRIQTRLQLEDGSYQKLPQSSSHDNKHSFVSHSLECGWFVRATTVPKKNINREIIATRNQKYWCFERRVTTDKLQYGHLFEPSTGRSLFWKRGTFELQVTCPSWSEQNRDPV